MDRTGNGFEEGGFASAVGTKECDAFAGCDGELNTRQGLALTVRLMEIAYFECSGLSHPSSFEVPDETGDANVVEVVRGRPSGENLVKGFVRLVKGVNWETGGGLGFAEMRRTEECYRSRDRIDRG